MRLIDADALIKKAKEEGAYDYVSAQEIEDAPTIDAVEVVRCKDCRYYNTTNCCDGCGWCERSGMDRGSWDNWFCADGEKERAVMDNLKPYVVIVRCKECKWGKPYSDKQLECDALGLGGLKFPDDYCSYGEREGE